PFERLFMRQPACKRHSTWACLHSTPLYAEPQKRTPKGPFSCNGWKKISQHLFNDFLELFVSNDGFLLNAQILHLLQNLRNFFVCRVVDAHLFQAECYRALAAFLAQHDVAAAASQRRVSAEHRQRLSNHKVYTDAGFAREI